MWSEDERYNSWRMTSRDIRRFGERPERDRAAAAKLAALPKPKPAKVGGGGPGPRARREARKYGLPPPVRTFGKRDRAALVKAAGNRCAYCGEHIAEDKACVVCVVPIREGGQLIWDNMLLSCRSCMRKRDRNPVFPKLGEGLDAAEKRYEVTAARCLAARIQGSIERLEAPVIDGGQLAQRDRARERLREMRNRRIIRAERRRDWESD